MVLVLEAYFDESGSSLDQRPILVLGGYIAPTEQWLSFSGKWDRVLNNYNLTHFHATELPNKHSKLFRHLSKENRKALVEELVSVISQHVDMGVAIVMSPDDWRIATTDKFRFEHGSAYGICMELLLMLASLKVGKDGGEPKRVNVFLEDGHKNACDAILRASLYKQATEPIEAPPEAVVHDLWENPLRTDFMRIGGVGLFPKITTKPLQAADLYVYLISNLLRPTSHEPFSGALRLLAKGKPHWYSVFGDN
jgi:hypothetical protein